MKKILILLTLILAILVTGCGKAEEKQSVEEVESSKTESQLKNLPPLGREIEKEEYLGKIESNKINFEDIGTIEQIRENGETIEAEMGDLSIKINKGTVYKTEVDKGIELPEFAEFILAEDGNIYQGSLDFELEFNPEKPEEINSLQISVIDSNDEENFGFLNSSMSQDEIADGKLTGRIVFQLSGPEVQAKTINFKTEESEVQIDYQL